MFDYYRFYDEGLTLHKRQSFAWRIIFSSCDHIRSILRIWSHLLKKSLMQNFIFCVSETFLEKTVEEDFEFTDSLLLTFHPKSLLIFALIHFQKAYQRFARSSPSKVFLGKCVLKICRKFTGEHPCWSLISIKLRRNFIEITLSRKFSCKFVVYFQNTFCWEHIWKDASDLRSFVSLALKWSYFMFNSSGVSESE